MNLALIVLRVVVGALFIGHGSQKLFGIFGGSGPAGTAEMFERLELRPAHRHALMAGGAEFFGGALLARAADAARGRDPDRRDGRCGDHGSCQERDLEQ